MAEFDTIAKHLIHTYPTDFARFALQQDDIQVLGVVETEQKRHLYVADPAVERLALHRGTIF